MPEEMDKFKLHIIRMGVGKNDLNGNSPKSYVSYLESAEKHSGTPINKETLNSTQNVNDICSKCEKSGKVSGKTIKNYKSAMNKYVEMINANYEYHNNDNVKPDEIGIKKRVEKKASNKQNISKSVFSLPNAVTLNGRSSSITNSLINGIIPVIIPTDEEILLALQKLGMSTESIFCVYCGDKHTEWDHLRPIIVNKKASGYITEIQNLVPACGKCNQSKGNSEWKEWINSDAKKSPKTRNIKGLEETIKRLDEYCEWKKTTILDFEKLVGSEEWTAYQRCYDNVIEILNKCNEKAKIIKNKIEVNRKKELANNR